MEFIGIIPARYQSSRFPGKPLVDIHGKTMIRRVYEQCLLSELTRIIVATDDERIATEVHSFGGEVIMTSETHQSGTDRIAEASEKLKLPLDAILINIQGDEPFINPEDINCLTACFHNKNTKIATLIKPIHSTETLFNTNSPKVVIGVNKQALYFSREAIPHLRGIDKKEYLQKQEFFQHIGIYAFKHKILQKLAALKPSLLEQSEGLEQLRWLENGYTIYTAQTDSECIAVDCPEDLKRIDEKFFS